MEHHRECVQPGRCVHCCKYGIALFDELEEHQAYSANVAYELGMMHQQQKHCLVLRHTSLPPVPLISSKVVRALRAGPPGQRHCRAVGERRGGAQGLRSRSRAQPAQSVFISSSVRARTPVRLSQPAVVPRSGPRLLFVIPDEHGQVSTALTAVLLSIWGEFGRVAAPPEMTPCPARGCLWHHGAVNNVRHSCSQVSSVADTMLEVAWRRPAHASAPRPADTGARDGADQRRECPTALLGRRTLGQREPFLARGGRRAAHRASLFRAMTVVVRPRRRLPPAAAHRPREGNGPAGNEPRLLEWRRSARPRATLRQGASIGRMPG